MTFNYELAQQLTATHSAACFAGLPARGSRKPRQLPWSVLKDLVFIRLCGRCRQPKTKHDFYDWKRAGNECKQCHLAHPSRRTPQRRAYNTSYLRVYQQSPVVRAKAVEHGKKQNQNRKIRYRALLSAFRADGCKRCGEQDSACLVAHHRDPKQKEFNVGSARSLSPERLVAELTKCVCLCENCHRKLHAGRFKLES